MGWKWSETLLSAFNEKYRPIFERLGCSIDKEERVIRHSWGELEREILISVEWKGSEDSHCLYISEIKSGRRKELTIGSWSDFVLRKLDEEAWKVFYAHCDFLVVRVIDDIAYSFRLLPVVHFSLETGLSIKFGEEQEVRIPTENVDERTVSSIFALASL